MILCIFRDRDEKTSFIDLQTETGLMKFITDNPNKLMAEVMSLPNRLMKESNKIIIINQVVAQFPLPNLQAKIPTEIRAVYNYLVKLYELVD
jgi:hypothetical protein